MPPPPIVKQLVVLSHPDPESFCAGIARRWQDRARKDHQACEVLDLYAEGFDPVLKAHEQPGKPGYAPLAENLAACRRLQQLDVLIFVYPVWFGSPPAMLKGYLERVVGYGISFTADARDPGPLSNVQLVQISTSALNTPLLAEMGVAGALHTIFDSYMADVFSAKKAHRLHLDTITEGMSEQQAAMKLALVDKLADRVCAEANADRWEQARRGMR